MVAECFFQIFKKNKIKDSEFTARDLQKIHQTNT